MKLRQNIYKNKTKKKILIALCLMTGIVLPTYANTPVSDIDINSLIAQAIESHPLVGAARADQEATKEGITAAKLNILPAPRLTTSYNDNQNLVSEVSIRQPLWTGGRLTANVNQAIFDDKAAVETIYEQQNQVAKTTIEAWQTYITAVAQQRVYLENLEQLSDFESMMQRRVKQGVSARIELDLVTNRILQEQNAYEAAVEQQRIAAARLEQIIGHPISQGSAYNVPPLKLLADRAKKASIDFEKLAFSDTSFYNPSVVKEHFQIESAKQEVKAQNASKYPTVYAEYKHTYDHEEEEDDGQFYMGLDYQPGAGFSNFALTRASEARVNSLIQNQEAARRNVMEDIQVQYQQFISAKNRELSLIAAVSGAQIVVNSYRRQFIAGRKSWLEVLNAVRELSDYQIQLVQVRADILASFHKLQVDFGVMPWQRFAHNREPVKMFNVTDPIKDWMRDQSNFVNNSFNSEDHEINTVTSVKDGYVLVETPTNDVPVFDETEYDETDYNQAETYLEDDTLEQPEDFEEPENEENTEVFEEAKVLEESEFVEAPELEVEPEFNDETEVIQVTDLVDETNAVDEPEEGEVIVVLDDAEFVNDTDSVNIQETEVAAEDDTMTNNSTDNQFMVLPISALNLL